jgi:hypothetical protein
MLTTKQIGAINRLRSKCKWTLGRIERHLQISRKTFKKYLLSPTRSQTRRSRPGKLEPFKATLAELIQQNPSMRIQRILHHLRVLGYKGGTATLRNHLRILRTKVGSLFDRPPGNDLRRSYVASHSG